MLYRLIAVTWAGSAETCCLLAVNALGKGGAQPGLRPVDAEGVQ